MVTMSAHLIDYASIIASRRIYNLQGIILGHKSKANAVKSVVAVYMNERT